MSSSVYMKYVVDDGGMLNGSGFNQDNDEDGCTVSVLQRMVITRTSR